MEHVVLAFYVLSLVSGPAAFALLAVVKKRAPSKVLDYFLLSWLGLSAVLLINLVDFYGGQIIGLRDKRAGFILMLFVFAATFVAVFAIRRIGFELVGRQEGPRSRVLFFSVSVTSYVTAIALAVFSESGETSFRFDLGYLCSTIFASALIVESAARLVRGRHSIAPTLRRSLSIYGALLIALATLAIANDTGAVIRLLGLESLAISPFFYLAGNIAAISRAIGVLSHPPANLTSPEVMAKPDVNHTTGTDRTSPPDKSAIGFAAKRWELSVREREILNLLLQGAEKHRMAEALFISPHTVKNHLHAIYRKSGAANRFQLLRLLDSHGATGDGPGSSAGSPAKKVD